MRTLLRFAAVFCLLAPGLVMAHADTITVTITGTATGSFGSTQFNQQAVTFTGQTTTGAIAACESASAAASCMYVNNGYSRSFEVGTTAGTVSVQGLGTFAMTGGSDLNFFAGVYDPESFSLGSLAGGLTMGVTMPSLGYDYNFAQSVPLTLGGATGSFAEAGCEGGSPSQCPVFATTAGGNLVLTDVYSNVYGQVLVTPTDLTPEPAAWVMLGTGLAGGLGPIGRTLRRRLGR